MFLRGIRGRRDKAEGKGRAGSVLLTAGTALTGGLLMMPLLGVTSGGVVAVSAAAAARGIVGAKKRGGRSRGPALISTGSVLTGGALLVPLLGFKAAGVAAGSKAAGIQSAIYGAKTSGLFSLLQFTGAKLAWTKCACAGMLTICAGMAEARSRRRASNRFPGILWWKR